MKKQRRSKEGAEHILTNKWNSHSRVARRLKKKKKSKAL
jgi:hypothetical protein